MRRTTDGGGAWSAIASPTSNTITSICVHSTNPSIVWVTGSGYSAGNKIWKSTNGGSSWTNISGSLPNVPANTVVYQNSSPDRLYIGTDIGAYYTDLNSGGWQDFNTGLPNVVVSELEIQYSSSKIRAATYGRGVWESPLISNALFSSSPDSIGVSVEMWDSTTTILQINNTGSATLTWSRAIVPASPWLTVTPASGSVSAGGSQNLTVKTKATDTIGTTQQASIEISTNDPLASPAVIPVSLYVLSPYVSLGIPVESNWNLVSVPLIPFDYATSAVFPSSTTQAFSYQSAGGYQGHDTLTNTPGYWLKFPAQENVSITGLPVEKDTVDVTANWNLIGSISETVPVSAIVPLGTSVQSPFFGYSVSGYSVKDTLKPGAGYWVKVSTNGKLILKPTSPPVPLLQPATSIPETGAPSKTAR